MRISDWSSDVCSSDLDHPFIGYVDDLIFTRALNYLSEIRPHLRARLQNSSLHAQLSATVAGFGLCVLPASVARTAPELVPILPSEISLTRSYWMVADTDIAEPEIGQASCRGKVCQYG